MKSLQLKKGEDRRLRAGHLWIYSNEVDTQATPLTAFEPGALCRVVDSRGKPLGQGYVNPGTLLAARLLSGDADAQIAADWFRRRIEAALALRARLYAGPYYRLVYGEADGLPGLVVDRYGDILVVQLGTAGMERLKPMIAEALQRVLKPRGIWFSNELAMRQTEGLPDYTEAVGEVPEAAEVVEGGARFEAPIRTGQKTGWFYDQHDNRDRLARYVSGRSVLDVFSYVGAWAVRALSQGASSALCVDSSQPALDTAARNAQRNGYALETRKGEAVDMLKALRQEGRSFDVVVVDPPALIKRRKDLDAGLEHYARLNRLAMELLAPDGVLVSCSCSHHLEEDALQRILLRESRALGRRLQILEKGGQGPDHPVHPAIPETRYLKALYCRVLAG
ncbi:MAG: class I SAM-dependent rRNA methyltransferase [Gammaproteobacteria bacterium]|nr:class I SAM-dependent rRNA methyltransferase [Gammaproteobacteria bacterium]